MAEEKRGRGTAPMMRLTQVQMERLADMVAERVLARLSEAAPTVERYMTCAEAAEFLGYKVNTVRKMVSQGCLPCERPNGGKPRFTKAALARWVRSRQAQ